jgi:putative inorganic carbon (hco3(-)) transporter
VIFATVHGFNEGAEKLGVLVVVALVAVALVGHAPRVRARARCTAILGALILTPILLTIDIWNTSQVRHLRGHQALAVAAIIAGVVVVGALAVLFRRMPRTLPLAAVAALPFRLPISTGATTSNLLIPLYLVVAAGVLAEVVPTLRRPGGSEARGPDSPPGSHATPGPDVPAVGSWWAWTVSARGLETLLAGSVVLYGVQACYSSDFSKALENVVFFYVPFALLLTLLRNVRWSRRTILECLAIAVGLAIVFVGIGFVEYHRRKLFLNPKVVQANEYDNYFRVNSVFFDPSIYGRFLALVMLAVTTVVLWSGRRRDVLVGAAVLVWLWGGLITSFSQSSIAALLLGLAVLAAWRWDVRSTVYVSLALLAVGAVVVISSPPSLHIGLTGKGGSASNATSGRTKLISGGLKLFVDRPLQGFGPGSFAQEYRRHEPNVTSSGAASASHTIPVTVAAEQGVVGLLLYVALLVSAFAVLFSGAGRSPPRIAIAACFAALVLHTWVYADFLEDPITWTLLGIGLALATRGELDDVGGKLGMRSARRPVSPAASQA